MTTQIATAFYALVIVGLFFLDRDSTAKPSPALWIPSAWLLIIGSRPVSAWFESGPTIAMKDQYAEGSTLDALVYGVLIVAGVVVLLQRHRRVQAFLRVNAPLVIFLSYCAASVAWSDYPFVAFKRWIKSVGDIVMVLIVLTDSNSISAIKSLWPRVGFILLPLSVLFIKYYPDLGRSYNPWTWEPMFSGVTTFKNLLGMTCLVFALGSLWRFLDAYSNRQDTYRTRHLIAHGALIAMAMWLFWAANSMTSLSCFLMAGGVMIGASWNWVAKRVWAVHAMVLLVICLSLFALFFDVGGGLVQSLGRDPTLTGRTTIWNIVRTISDSPLVGTGFESFWMGERLERAQQLIGQDIQEAHNGYLELYLNLGWIGVGLLSVLIATGYRQVIAMLRRDPLLGRLRLAFFVAAVTYSLTEAGFRIMNPLWIGFLLAVIAVPKVSVSKKRAARIGTGDARPPIAIQPPGEFPRVPASFQEAGSRQAPNGAASLWARAKPFLGRTGYK